MLADGTYVIREMVFPESEELVEACLTFLREHTHEFPAGNAGGVPYRPACVLEAVYERG